MARSFSNAKLLSIFAVDSLSLALRRRGYAAASQSVASASQGGGRAARGDVMGKKSGEESAKTSWVPDPVTGYYRPENRADEMDVADLREMVLNNKIRRN